MRHPRLADRLAFAERFTFAVVQQPFYSDLRRVAAMQLPRRAIDLDALDDLDDREPARAEPTPDLPHAA